jgi:hypothetical protein
MLFRKELTSWAGNAPPTGVTVPAARVTEPATARVTELALQRPTKLFASPMIYPPRHPVVQSGQVQIEIGLLRQRRMRQRRVHQQRRREHKSSKQRRHRPNL